MFEAYLGATDYSYRHFGIRRRERYSPENAGRYEPLRWLIASNQARW